VTAEGVQGESAKDTFAKITAPPQGEEKNPPTCSGMIRSPQKGEKRKVSGARSDDKTAYANDSESIEEVTPAKVKYFRCGKLIYATNTAGSKFEILDPTDGCDTLINNGNDSCINNVGLDDNDNTTGTNFPNDADFNENVNTDSGLGIIKYIAAAATNTNTTTSSYHTPTPAYCPITDDFAFYHCNHAFAIDENDCGCCGCGSVNPGNQTCLSGPYSCPDHHLFRHQCSRCTF
jgi:hypothetical protein